MKINLYILHYFILFLFACSDRGEDYSPKSYLAYDNEISHPKISIYQDKHLVVRSTSKKLLKNDNDDAILVGNVVADFYNDQGLHRSRLYSDSARVENISNNLRALGNVRVVSDSGYVLFSNEIYWNNQYKLVTSDDSVMFTNLDLDTLYGVGFESNMDLTNSKIYKPYGILNERNK